MADKQGVPLDTIDGFSEEAARRLAELWITTAEELAAAAVREDGPRGLAEYLEIAESEVDQLVGLAQSALPPTVAFAPGDLEVYGLGALDEPEDEGPEVVPFVSIPLPARVDLHDRMPPVRNQQNRGTCVAHACVAVREFLLGEDSEQGDLSEQFLYWACKERDGHNGPGTYIRVGMACLKDLGVCSEEVWRYNPEEMVGNEGQGPPPDDAQAKAPAYRIDDSERLKATWVNALRQQLAEERPIAFAVPVYNYWYAEPGRSTGDIRLPLSTDHEVGGHAMCLVGYQNDPDVPGGGYFLVRNSWGTTWGRDNEVGPGHARMPYAYMAKYGLSAFAAFRDPDPEVEPVKPKWGWLKEWWKRLFG